MTVVALVDDGSIGSLTSLIKSVSDLARNQSREDLVARLEECRQQLASASVRMLVVGDFKQGKSTLVNALINHNVCPTDADFATMVPTIVRHGTEPSATLYNATDGSRAQARSIEVKDVGRWVCEQEGADPERDNVRSCEIRLPIEWMAGGAQLVDMPGYGGLDAVAGTRIVAELRAANAVLFVTDASQELTKPELDLLRMAHQHCPLVVVVVTKIDAHIDWRLIRDINAGHLRRAGLEMPIIAVSALRRIAIDELVGFVQRELLAQAELTRVRHATVEVGSSLAQVRSVVQAELDSFDPVRQVQIAQDLRRTLREITDMRLDSASWHRFLRDKTDDLRTSAIEQLDSGLRELVTEAEIVVGEFDPAVIWDEFQQWLRSRATSLVSDIYLTIAEEAQNIGRQLVSQFDGATGVGGLSGGAGELFLRSLRIETPAHGVEGHLSNTAIDGSWSAAEPLLGVGAFLPGLGPVSLAAAAVAGLVYGRRALRERKENALGARRDQAKAFLQDYSEDVLRVTEKPIDRFVNQLYRTLRDGVLRRVDELERSTSDSLASSSVALSSTDSERSVRRQQLTGELNELNSVQVQFDDLARKVAPRG